MSNVTVFAAFGAGLLSFLSPCVLPLIPGYLSFVSGKSGADLRSGADRAGIFWRTLFFVLGFSVIFIGLGLIFSGGGMLLAGRAARTITVIAGMVIMVFGLNMIFDFIKILNRELRFHASARPAGAIGSFAVGMAFGAGWTPCIGPILGSILLVASRAGRVPEAALLLGSYSAGLALPFLLAGLFFERLSPLMDWFKRRGREIRIVSGLLLVILGLAMALGRLSTLNGVFMRWGFQLKSFLGRDPVAASMVGLLVWAVLAGLSAIPLGLALLRKLRPGPWRYGLPVLFLVLCGLEATGIIRLLVLLSDWFVFQGA
jgi:cytochrome c-type biogenesis protein